MMMFFVPLHLPFLFIHGYLKFALCSSLSQKLLSLRSYGNLSFNPNMSIEHRSPYLDSNIQSHFALYLITPKWWRNLVDDSHFIRL